MFERGEIVDMINIDQTSIQDVETECLHCNGKLYFLCNRNLLFGQNEENNQNIYIDIWSCDSCNRKFNVYHNKMECVMNV
jgi:uncharacterized protein with PIN domain